MAFEKGVKSVVLDLETKELTVTFKRGKNTKENLKKAVTKIGYDADDLVADQKAYDNLPTCCKRTRHRIDRLALLSIRPDGQSQGIMAFFVHAQ